MTDQPSESTWSQKQLADAYLDLNKQVYDAAVALGRGYQQLKTFVESIDTDDAKLAQEEFKETSILGRAYRAVESFVAAFVLLGDKPSMGAVKAYCSRIIRIKSADVEDYKPALTRDREDITSNPHLAPWAKPYLHDYLIKEVFLPAAEKGNAMIDGLISKRKDNVELRDIQEYFADAGTRLRIMLESYQKQQEARLR